MSSDEELLEHARSVLKQGRRRLDPAVAIEMRWALDASIARPKRASGLGWKLPSLAIAAGAAAVVVMMARAGGDDASVRVVAGPAKRSGDVLILSEGAVVEIGRGRLRSLGEARIQMPVLAPDEVELVLDTGVVDLEVAATQRFRVTTPVAAIAVVGTRFQVEAGADRTEVRVESGTAEVTERLSGRVLRVPAGARRVLERPAVAERAVEEAPPAVPPPEGGATPAPRSWPIGRSRPKPRARARPRPAPERVPEPAPRPALDVRADAFERPPPSAAPDVLEPPAPPEPPVVVAEDSDARDPRRRRRLRPSSCGERRRRHLRSLPSSPARIAPAATVIRARRPSSTRPSPRMRWRSVRRGGAVPRG